MFPDVHTSAIFRGYLPHARRRLVLRNTAVEAPARPQCAGEGGGDQKAELNYCRRFIPLPYSRPHLVHTRPPPYERPPTLSLFLKISRSRRKNSRLHRRHEDSARTRRRRCRSRHRHGPQVLLMQQPHRPGVPPT
ncbi:uncharacterized protein LOC122247677 [Penaeus japonicus]|uniref:uncharacterized protein LOC122247677 n=1 Tax=Penaeus japonicus TaxID=27405 RepID=UPI001C70FC5B|nr:uncharacterized protein LOC122247677 [Penaeus japonicus]